MNSKKIVILVMMLCSFFCSSCVLTVPRNVNENIRGIVPEPSKDLATVVFLRPSGLGGKRPLIVYEDNQMIGAVGGANYFSYNTKPGQKTFCAIASPFGIEADQHASFLRANLEPGKIYYVWVRFIANPSHLYTEIRPIRVGDSTWQNLQGWLYNCRQTELTKESYVWTESKAKWIHEIREKYYKHWITIKDDRDSAVIHPEDGVLTPVVPFAKQETNEEVH